MASLLVLVVGMLGTGWWLTRQVEDNVAREAACLTTLFVDSLVGPLLQVRGGSAVMAPGGIAAMDAMVDSTLRTDGVVAICIWGPNGRVLYSTDATQIGRIFAPEGHLLDAFSGHATWEWGSDQEGEPILPQDQSQVVMGIYSPIRDPDTGRIVAVTEVYKAAGPLLQDIAAAQRETWLILGAAAVAMYLLLAGFIQRTSTTIMRQQRELGSHVTRLEGLLAENTALHERTLQVTHRAATLNERILRAIGADLHDGVAQYLGVALLRFDEVAAYHEEHPDARVDEPLAVVSASLAQALREVRAVVVGLGMPELDRMSLDELVAQVVRAHERSYRARVTVAVRASPERVALSIKTTLYRVLQEGLSNAYRHGGGIDERLMVWAEGGILKVTISDGGPGFDADAALGSTEHTGLSGMRIRVESLGGRLSVQSVRGGADTGTRLRIELPLLDDDGR